MLVEPQKVPNWKKLCFQLEKIIFPVGNMKLRGYWLFNAFSAISLFLWHPRNDKSWSKRIWQNRTHSQTKYCHVFLYVMLDSFQHLSAVKDKKRLAARFWNLRLSERRTKLAWSMPCVSRLDEVKQVIRLRSSKISFIFLNKVWSGWRVWVGSQLIAQCRASVWSLCHQQQWRRYGSVPENIKKTLIKEQKSCLFLCF